ncbi:hypothetical protein NWO25_00055 [Enterococcus lactis]|nr:hypothetical protein [Enterococcus lactis]
MVEVNRMIKQFKESRK